MDLLWFLIVGLIAGWLAGKIMKGSGYGILGDLVVGIIGAMIGGEIFGTFGLIESIFSATVGAILLIALIRVIKKA